MHYLLIETGSSSDEHTKHISKLAPYVDIQTYIMCIVYSQHALVTIAPVSQ